MLGQPGQVDRAVTIIPFAQRGRQQKPIAGHYIFGGYNLAAMLTNFDNTRQKYHRVIKQAHFVPRTNNGLRMWPVALNAISIAFRLINKGDALQLAGQAKRRATKSRSKAV